MGKGCTNNPVDKCFLGFKPQRRLLVNLTVKQNDYCSNSRFRNSIGLFCYNIIDQLLRGKKGFLRYN